MRFALCTSVRGCGEGAEDRVHDFVLKLNMFKGWTCWILYIYMFCSVVHICYWQFVTISSRRSTLDSLDSSSAGSETFLPIFVLRWVLVLKLITHPSTLARGTHLWNHIPSKSHQNHINITSLYIEYIIVEDMHLGTWTALSGASCDQCTTTCPSEPDCHWRDTVHWTKEPLVCILVICLITELHSVHGWKIEL